MTPIKTLSKLGLLCTISILTAVTNLWAVGERSLWVYEQLSTPPLPTVADKNRSQFSLGLENYQDSLSFDAQGVVDLTYLEIVVHGSKRAFLDFTTIGPLIEAQMAGMQNSMFIEFARNYTTPDNNYGRLGIAYLQFFPQGSNWARLSLSSGIISSEKNPWSLNLHLAYYVSFLGANKNLVVSVASSKIVKSDSSATTSLGGFISWGYRMRPLFEDVQATYEQMLFSLGPSAEWISSLGTFSLRLPWRLWLDRQYNLVNGNYVPGNPVETNLLPDLQFNWTLSF